MKTNGFSGAFMALASAAVFTACAQSAPPAGSGVVRPSVVGTADFRSARNSICIAGSDDIAALNALIEGSTPAEQAEILRQVVDRIEVAQQQLDELTIPAEIATFVAEDAARRAQRIELMTRLADAVEAGGFTSADAEAVDAELNDLNILTEAEEDANRLAHCP